MTAVVFNLFFNISNYWSLFQLTINLHLTCPLMQKIRYTKLLSNATQICIAPPKKDKVQQQIKLKSRSIRKQWLFRIYIISLSCFVDTVFILSAHFPKTVSALFVLLISCSLVYFSPDCTHVYAYFLHFAWLCGVVVNTCTPHLKGPQFDS